jgi:hypothetical protein
LSVSPTGKPTTILPLDKRELREALCQALRERQQRDSAPDNATETTTSQDHIEQIHLEILLKFNSLRCRDPRRCKMVRCRRSGHCADRAETLRKFAPAPPQVDAPRQAHRR